MTFSGAIFLAACVLGSAGFAQAAPVSPLRAAQRPRSVFDGQMARVTTRGAPALARHAVWSPAKLAAAGRSVPASAKPRAALNRFVGKKSGEVVPLAPTRTAVPARAPAALRR